MVGRMERPKEGPEIADKIIMNVGIGAFFVEEHPMLLRGDAGVATILGALARLVGQDKRVKAVVAGTKSNTGPSTVGIGMG